MTQEERQPAKKPRKSKVTSYEVMLSETRELSKRILERMEELYTQFPSPELADAVRRMRETDRDLPPTGV